VAVTEACANALTHGRGDAAPRVGWEVGGCTARFWVRDYSGQGWARIVHPTRADPAGRGGDGRVGGFGLALMRGLMDDVDIRQERAGTTVELTKRFC